MSLQYFNEDVDLPSLDYELIATVLKKFIKFCKAKEGEINFIFCSDEYLLSLNNQFLQHDYYTDVITFDYSIENIISGDVFISTEMVYNNSITYNQNLEDELLRVISHGLLHLLKFDDKQPEDIKVMRMKEEELLLKFNTWKKVIE